MHAASGAGRIAGSVVRGAVIHEDLITCRHAARGRAEHGAAAAPLQRLRVPALVVQSSKERERRGGKDGPQVLGWERGAREGVRGRVAGLHVGIKNGD